MGSTWSNKIAKVIWAIGGINSSFVQNSTPLSVVYTSEIINTGQDVTFLPSDGIIRMSNKVGLMYITDYGYAVPNNYWSYRLYHSWAPSATYSIADITSNNWMLKGVNEMTITRCGNSDYYYQSVSPSGMVSCASSYSNYFGLRQTFYLTENTTIDMTTHAGTLADPYRVS